MPSLALIQRQLALKQPKPADDDLQTALSAAIEQAVAGVLASHQPPAQAPSRSVERLLRPPTPLPLPPAPPQPAAQPRELTGLNVEYDAQGRPRAVALAASDGSHEYVIVKQRDERGWPTVVDFTGRGALLAVHRDPDGRILSLAPLGDVPPQHSRPRVSPHAQW